MCGGPLILGWVYAFQVRRCVARTFGDRVFRVRWLAYMPSAFFVLMAFLILRDGRDEQRMMGFIIFVVMLCIGTGYAYFLAISWVSVRDGRVTYVEGGKKKWEIALSEIVSVTTRTMVELNVNTQWEQKRLPMHFHPLLVVMLMNYRPHLQVEPVS